MGDIDWKLMFELTNALAWPVVALVALIVLHKPIAGALVQLAKRAKSFTVFDVSLELATLPELQTSWIADTNADVRKLTSSLIFDSYSYTLFAQLASAQHADYAIVDLRDGKEWLTSRLYIFAMILGEVIGVRAFVFLVTSAGANRRFLGVATTADIRRSLGARYPWFDEAAARAMASAYPPAPVSVPVAGAEPVSDFSNAISPVASADSSRGFVRLFIQAIQRTIKPIDLEASSYLELSPTAMEPIQKWERARWIDGDGLERVLGDALSFDWVEDSTDLPRREIAGKVMRKKSSLVALVDGDRRFLGLADRFALLSQQVAEPASKE